MQTNAVTLSPNGEVSDAGPLTSELKPKREPGIRWTDSLAIMGQAKRRGTFEQRLAAALERDRTKPVLAPPAIIFTDDSEARQVARAMRRRPAPLLVTALMAACAAGMPRR